MSCASRGGGISEAMGPEVVVFFDVRHAGVQCWLCVCKGVKGPAGSNGRQLVCRALAVEGSE